MNGLGIFFLVLFLLLIGAAVGWIVFTQLRARRLGVSALLPQPGALRQSIHAIRPVHCALPQAILFFRALYSLAHRIMNADRKNPQLQLPAPTISSYNPFARSEPSAYGTPTPAPGGIRGWFNDKLRGRSTNRSGAYEQPGRAGRGFGPLDPDEAWDTRVGPEADHYGPGGYYEEQELGLRNDPYSGSGYNMNLASTPGATAPDHARGRSQNRDSLGLPGGAGRSAANPFDDDAAEPSNISLRGVSPRPIDTGNSARPLSGVSTVTKNDSPTERRSVFRENV
ncbi:acid phosphatase-like protein [Apiospora saccharicola]|uniref:Acid phosphatase-like protein n=1 Tax=Apiospora saccharicola TaxID=335842 RepID=A0ABR1ULJ0_9PEZI